MALEDELRNVAGEIADRLQVHHSDLDDALTPIEARKRLLNYSPRVGPDFQCPRCWMENEKRSVLRTVVTNIDDDVFRCDVCHLELVF